MFSNLYLSIPQISCFDGEGDAAAAAATAAAAAAATKAAADAAAADAAAAAAAAAAAGDDGKTFNTTDVNRIVEERLARDRKSREEQSRKLETQLSEVLKLKDLTENERAALQESLEDVKKQSRTKEETAKHEQRQLHDEYEVKLSEERGARELWETRFRQSSIDRSLQDAAVGNDAYNSEQVVKLLSSMTKLIPNTDEAGQEIDGFKTVVDFPTRDDKGKEIVMQGTPDEIVKRMKELGDYANLFKGNVVSGLGANSATGGNAPGSSGRVDVSSLTMEQYAKLRKENPAVLGL